MNDQLDLFEDEPEQPDMTLHIPVITEAATEGAFRVYCYACSKEVGDYVPVCSYRPRTEWPPTVLVLPAKPPRRGMSRARPAFPLSPVGRSAPETSKAAATAAEPRAQTKQAQVLALIREAGSAGLTDWELECATRLTHQSVSAARNVLMNRGLVYDSGKRRRTKTGNRAIAWRATQASAGSAPLIPLP